jgi:hypothetical protein
LSPSNSKQTKRKYNIRKHLSKKRKAKKRTHILRTFSLMRSFLAWGKALAVALALALAQLSISTNAKTSKRSNAATNLLSNRGDPMDCGFNSISLCREEKRRRGEERRGEAESRAEMPEREGTRRGASLRSNQLISLNGNGMAFFCFVLVTLYLFHSIHSSYLGPTPVSRPSDASHRQVGPIYQHRPKDEMIASAATWWHGPVIEADAADLACNLNDVVNHLPIKSQNFSNMDLPPTSMQVNVCQIFPIIISTNIHPNINLPKHLSIPEFPF